MARVLSLVVFLCFTVAAYAQDVRITEFLATNTTGIVDDDGTPQGWIEIWNPNLTSKVSMLNWKLSNGTTEFVLPGVEIMPDGYLVVWASGKNRRVVTTPLHTNFTIPPEGGNLILTPPSGSTSFYTTSSYQPYPEQQPDISYGRDAASPTLKGYYSKPSPGNANNYSGAGVSGKVVPSEPSKTFTGSFALTLTEADPATGAVIRYTTNGTVPTFTDDGIANDSPIYTGPITVGASQRIRARVFTPGLLPGETESRGYMLLDANTAAFSSAIPIVVISNFGFSTPPATGDQDAYMWTFEPGADGRARLTSAPTLVTRVAIDRRGSSTLDNPKTNMNVEARKSRDNEDQDISLLGMPAGSDWVFHGPFEFDRTLIHNPFAYALSNAIGRYAPRTKIAEVFLDVNGAALTFTNTASGDYFGVYNIVEKIRRGKDRVDIETLDDYDNFDPPADPEVLRTGGYILKVDRKDAGDFGFSTPHEGSPVGTLGFAYVYPNEMEILEPQRDPQEQYIKSFMTAMDQSIYAANATDPVNGYAKYLDVDAAIDHHLLNVIPMNVDGLRLSGYMYKNRGGKLTYGPAWDFDRAMFAANDSNRSDNPLVWRSVSGDRGTDFFNYTWWAKLFSYVDFYQNYIDRYTNFRRGPLSNASVNALIDSLNAMVTDEAANRDVVRWGKTKRAYSSPITGQTYPASQTAEIQRLKDWLQQRQGFMETQWVRPVVIAPSGGNVAPGTTVTLSAPAGTIYYTTDGSDPRPSGGAVPSGANVKVYSPGSPIVIDATTRIRARAYNPNHTALTGGAATSNPPLVSKWSGRTDARFAVDAPVAVGGLIVTEVNYHPTNPTAAELLVNPVFGDGDFEFIEVKNVGATTLDLADAQFTAGVSFSFTGENALSLAPGAHAIIAANPTAFALRYGTQTANVVGPFAGDLDNAGERLLLVAANGDSIMDFTYDDWYPTTDGLGQSLVVYDQSIASAVSSEAANWRPSSVAGGSPGRDEPPFVTTLAATAITATSVTLNAQVIPNGTSTTPEFVFENVRYPVADVVAPGVTPVEKAITGLTPHTTYTFHAEATNALGARVGGDLTFTTANRPPDALAKNVHLATVAPMTLQVLGADSDPDADPLTITAVTQGQLGAVTTNGTTIVYEPTAEYRGNDVFTYTVSDNFGGSTTATVTLVNRQPVAQDRQFHLPVGAPITIEVLGSASDPDADPLTLSAVTQGERGVVSTNGTSILYEPTAGYVGNDVFTYTISDGFGGVSSATVTLVNAPPVAQNRQFHSPIRAPMTIEVLGSASDTDADSVTISAITQGTHGVVSTNGTSILYEPAASYAGNDVFTYTISDGFGGASSATVTVFNRQPVAAADLVVTNGETVTFDPRTNDTDPDSDPLAVLAVTPGKVGTTALLATGITYTPGAQFFGRDTFTYTVTDGSAIASATVQVRSGIPIAHPSTVKGVQVVGATAGDTYGTLGLPSAGAFAGTVQSGRSREQAIFGPDGSLRMKAGGSAPALAAVTINRLGQPSGQAVLASLKGAGVSKSNDTVLYAGLESGEMRIAAREGEALPNGLGTIKSFVSIDGNGSTVFFVAKLGGVSAANDTALCAALPEGGLRVLVREGDFIDGTSVAVIGTLVASKGTAAEGRWRSDASAIGVRLTFAGKQQALYTIPAAAAAASEWTLWSRSGDVFTNVAAAGGDPHEIGMAESFGLPGFSASGVAYAAVLRLGVSAVSKANDTALLRETASGPTLLAAEGSPAPGQDGTSLGANFASFGDPVAGAEKSAAFIGTLAGFGVTSSTRTGVWAADRAGVVRLLARAGGDAPGGGRWSSFESLVLPDGPESGPLFVARLSGKDVGVSKSNNRGLWGVDSTGTLRLLLRTGQFYQANGANRMLKSFVALVAAPGSLGASSGFDDDGNVTARATFTDRTEAFLQIAIP